jgi:hypothetical protein
MRVTPEAGHVVVELHPISMLEGNCDWHRPGGQSQQESFL